MKALIPITKTDDGEQLVDARMLHAVLGVRRDFSTWLKERVARYGFIEDEDYITHSPNRGNESTNNLRAPIEYGLTLDMAKQLCMVENNAKGMEARKYFIECERRARQTRPALPGDYLSALKALVASEEEKVLLAEKNAELKHHLANEVGERQALQDITRPFGYVTIQDAAKMINHPCLGPNNMFKFLHKNKILKYVGREEKKYDFYSRYSNYFKLIATHQNGGHEGLPYSKILINLKGVVALHRKVLLEMGPWRGMQSPEEIIAAFNERLEDGN